MTSFPNLWNGSRGLSLAGCCLLFSLSACGDRAGTFDPVPQAPMPPAPVAVTMSASDDFFAGTATLYGIVNPFGTTTDTWFEWGANALTATAITQVEGTGTQTVSAAIHSLAPATPYYYRVVARNSRGVSYGATLSFVPEPPSALRKARVAFVRAGNIYIQRLIEGGTEQVQLTQTGSFGHPAWSPDGRRIAFASLDFPGRIYVMNADGSELRFFAEGHSPAWSPDGRWLAFSGYHAGSTAIFVRSLEDEGKPAVRIGFDQGWHDFPAWSPDGTRIAFVSDWVAFDFAQEIYIANADGSGITQVTSGFADGFAHTSSGPVVYTVYSQPSWSPDGRRLAVVACVAWQYYNCAMSSVGVMDTDGSGFRFLASTTGFARPTWAPDGSTLVFSRTCWDHQCPSDVFEMPLEGGKDRVLIAEAHSGVLSP